MITRLSNVLIFDNILGLKQLSSLQFNINEIVNKFLLTGGKFTSELHLRQLEITYSACWPFTKHRERIQKFKETDDLNYVYRNKLDIAYFPHDDAYADRFS